MKVHSNLVIFTEFFHKYKYFISLFGINYCFETLCFIPVYIDNNFLEGNSIKSQNDSIIFSQPDANRRKVYTNVEKIEKKNFNVFFLVIFFLQNYSLL